MTLYFYSLIFIVFTVFPLLAKATLTGDWHGLAKTNKEQTRFVLHVTPHQDQYQVSVSLPDIGVSKWPAMDPKVKTSGLVMDLPSDSGMQRINLTLDDGQLTGTWQDQPQQPPSELTLSKVKKHSNLKEQRLIIKGSHGNIGVSYLLPAAHSLTSSTSLPAIVLTHGSGPVTRDINRFTAESFANAGIAAIFYDKRGTGETEGEYDDITFAQLADDAIQVAKYFQATSGIKSVGFWGHSQGGWIAPLAASKWQQSAFAIMSAGPTVSPAREAQWSYIYPILDHPKAPEIMPHIRDIVAAWHQGLRQDDFDQYHQLNDQYKHEKWYEQTGLDGLRTWFLGQFYDSYQRFMDYNPAVTFVALNKPLLALYSLDDESIDSDESIAILKNYKAQGKPFEIVQYQGYSHSMRKIAQAGQALRFPNFPGDYFARQVKFIQAVVY